MPVWYTAEAAGWNPRARSYRGRTRTSLYRSGSFGSIEGIALVRSNREEGKQTLCFSSRPFILCGLPLRPLPKGQMLFERRNGNFVLQITGHPDFGVPYGQDRIVPIFLATLAVRQQSQTIRFRSAGEMLDTFGMHKGGFEYRRLVAAFERIFGATMFFGTETSKGSARVVQRSRFNFLREARIWYAREPDSKRISDEFDNVIVLSDEFYSEIVSHPIPTDLDAVKALTASPGLVGPVHVAFVSMLCVERRRANPYLWPVRTGRSTRELRVRKATEVSRDPRTLFAGHPGPLARVHGTD